MTRIGHHTRLDTENLASPTIDLAGAAVNVAAMGIQKMKGD